MPFDFKPNPEYDGTLSLQYLINGDSPSAASPEARIAANRLVGTYQTNIYGFIDSQRRLARTSGFPQSSRYMNLPGLEVGHRRNGKHETVSINAKPGEAQVNLQVRDINSDGYFALIYSAQYNYPSVPHYDIKLNGIKIGTVEGQYAPEFAMYVFAFGKTAFLCDSINNKMNPVLGGKSPLVCTPPRKKVTGSKVGQHTDGFGYFLFNFKDKSNPIFTSTAWPDSDFSQHDGEPKLKKITWYPDPKQSPLDVNGHNEVTSKVTEGGQFQLQSGCTIAEFYSGSTKDTRSVQSTWKKAGGSGSLSGVGSASVSYMANDKPLTDLTCIFISGHTNPVNFNVSFNLESKADHSDQGQHDYSEYVVGNDAFANGGVKSGQPGNGPSRTFSDWGSFAQALKGG